MLPAAPAAPPPLLPPCLPACQSVVGDVPLRARRSRTTTTTMTTTTTTTPPPTSFVCRGARVVAASREAWGQFQVDSSTVSRVHDLRRLETGRGPKFRSRSGGVSGSYSGAPAASQTGATVTAWLAARGAARTLQIVWPRMSAVPDMSLLAALRCFPASAALHSTALSTAFPT